MRLSIDDLDGAAAIIDNQCQPLGNLHVEVNRWGVAPTPGAVFEVSNEACLILCFLELQAQAFFDHFPRIIIIFVGNIDCCVYEDLVQALNARNHETA